jgi:hypothetical protein
MLDVVLGGISQKNRQYDIERRREGKGVKRGGKLTAALTQSAGSFVVAAVRDAGVVAVA